MHPKVIFVDVDDTLIRSVGTKRIPIPSTIARIRASKEVGNQLFLWSSGGAEYARTTALELGIETCFDGFLLKPNVYVDDQPVSEWRYCTHRYPNQDL
jgi:hydroxymethylpyrimidine pyrophosphatase-like HAD family hydrolase